MFSSSTSKSTSAKPMTLKTKPVNVALLPSEKTLPNYTKRALIYVFSFLSIFAIGVGIYFTLAAFKSHSNSHPISADDNDSSSATTRKSSSPNSNMARSQLTYNQLSGSASQPSSYVNYAHFLADAGTSAPPDASNSFHGTFSIANENARSNYNYEAVRDDYAYGNNEARRYLPPIANVDLVQSASADAAYDHLIPYVRHNQRTSHAYWEYILSPGRVWRESSDGAGNSAMNRAVLPFALTQRNSQCIHNGVFMFLFNNNGGGSVSRVWYQITSETCMYFKANFWGMVDGVYDHQFVMPGSGDVIAEFLENEVALRIPTKALSDIGSDYAGVNANNIGKDNLSPEHITMYGVYVGEGGANVHYVGDYVTRSGDYPYPASLVAPSYSIAKSAFLTTAALYMQQKFSANVFGASMRKMYEPFSNSDWDDVTLNDCLDMATGNYRFTQFLSDEALLAVENEFFLPQTHAAKYQHATTYYNRRTSPGNTWVYHSSDHYLCTYALQLYLREYSGDGNADIYDEIYENVYRRVGASQVMADMKRTYDSVYEPFGSHGMYGTADDFVKFSKLYNVDNGHVGGGGSGGQVLDATELDRALQRDGSDVGFAISDPDDPNPHRYQNGFWASAVLKTSSLNCDVYVPYMRGYGGIVVALFPNNVVYYFVGDNNEKHWMEAAVEINKISPFC